MKINTKKVMVILSERIMTQTELAELCGISRQNVSTIMTRGTCLPKTAGRIANGLGVPVSEIVKEE